MVCFAIFGRTFIDPRFARQCGCGLASHGILELKDLSFGFIERSVPDLHTVTRSDQSKGHAKLAIGALKSSFQNTIDRDLLSKLRCIHRLVRSHAHYSRSDDANVGQRAEARYQCIGKSKTERPI